MNNTLREGKGRRALAALAELARASARPPTPAELDNSLRALRSRSDAGRAEGPRRCVTSAGPWSEWWRRHRRWWPWASFVPGARTLPALTYRVEGGSLVEGGYLRESGRTGIKLFFTEGTEFILTPGTRSRLRAVDASGARIAIEHGTASFQVTPAPAGDRRWQVDVGPFLVTVKGTVFTVSWDAATEKFELKLRHGRVTVSGPVTGGEIALRAGQRLLVDLPQGEAVISDQKPEEPVEVSAGPAARAAEPLPARPSRAKHDGDRRWALALAAGQLDAFSPRPSAPVSKRRWKGPPERICWRWRMRPATAAAWTWRARRCSPHAGVSPVRRVRSTRPFDSAAWMRRATAGCAGRSNGTMST